MKTTEIFLIDDLQTTPLSFDLMLDLDFKKLPRRFRIKGLVRVRFVSRAKIDSRLGDRGWGIIWRGIFLGRNCPGEKFPGGNCPGGCPRTVKLCLYNNRFKIFVRSAYTSFSWRPG